MAKDFTVGKIIDGDGEYLQVVGVEIDRTPWTKAIIECGTGDPNEEQLLVFLCGSETPCAIVHNNVQGK